MKKVIILHRTQGKGVEAVHLLGIFKAFNELGFNPEFISPPGVTVTTEDVKKGAVKILAKLAPQFLFELMEMFSNLNLYKRLRANHNEGEVSVLYERYAFFGSAGSWFARKKKIPHILEVNYTSYDDLSLRKRTKVFMPFLRKHEKRLFKKVDLIVPVSSRLADRIKKMGVPEEKILISPNAVDLEKFDLEEIRKNKRDLGITLKKPVIGFVGSFAPWHRVDLLIKAAQMLSSKYPSISLLLVGDGKTRSEMERIVSKEQKIHAVFTGFVPHNLIPDYINEFDIAVMPHSNDYGSPMKIFEYMAMAKAVVAPDYPPIRDVIQDGENGLIFTPGNEQELANKIELLLNDPGLLKRIQNNARKSVEDEHNWKSRVQRMLDRLNKNGITIE